MTDLAIAIQHDHTPRPDSISVLVKEAATIYGGALVGIDAAGYLDHWDDVAGHQFLGILQDTVVGDVSEGVEGIVNVSGVKLTNVAIAGTFVIADTNSLIYCADDNVGSLSKSASSNVAAVGWACRFRSAGFGDVILFTPQEHLALN